MKNTALVITILATLIGTASVSFGDTSCAKNLTVKSGLSKLPDLKDVLVRDDGTSNGAISIPNDPRHPIDRNKNPEYNSIGILSNGRGRGSAWLGNDCLVWTAKHVLGRDKKVIGQKVKFSVGQSSNPSKDFEYTVEGEVVASGNPNPSRPDDGGEDWALVKLNKSIGKQVGYIPTSQYSVKDATTCKTLEVAGYPGEKTVKNLWWQTHCDIDTNQSDSTALNVGCPVTPGNSGGPLLCRETDGSLYAIGIMNQRERSNTRGIAVNLTFDWREAKAAFQKYMATCN